MNFLFAWRYFKAKKTTNAINVIAWISIVAIVIGTASLILVVTIVCWNYTLDWIGYRFPRFQRFFYPPPLPLVRDGALLRRNMRQELITIDELMSHLRQEGIDDIADNLRRLWEKHHSSGG